MSALWRHRAFPPKQGMPGIRPFELFDIVWTNASSGREARLQESAREGPVSGRKCEREMGVTAQFRLKSSAPA
jgi:hypothetical protein